MPLAGEHACRISDPEQYERIRRVNCDIEVDGACIDVIYGIEADESSEIQAYRYPIEDWSEAAARNHCREHDGTFEPAADDEGEQDGMKQREWFEIRMQGEDAAEIEIFEEIGGWFGGVSVAAFKERFDEVRGRSRIKLLLNSPGGSVFDGIALYNLLSGVRPKLSVEVLGVAASAASVIALAGHELAMGEGAYFMIHDPWGWAIGDSDEMLRVAERLEKMRDEIASIYAKHSGLEMPEVIEQMAAETWFTAAEAVEAGFADRVIEHEDQVAALAFDLERFEHPPRPLLEIAARARARPGRRMPANTIPAADCGRTREVAVDRTEIVAAIGELNEEERIQLAAEAGFVPRAEHEALEGRIAALEEVRDHTSRELQEARAWEHGQRKAQVIGAAAAAGKFKPEKRAFWEERFDQDPAGTVEILDGMPDNPMFRQVGSGDPGETDELGQGPRTMLAAMGYSDAEIEGGGR